MPASPVLGAPSVLTFMLAASTLALSACGPAPKPSGAAGEPEKPAPTASAPAADASPSGTNFSTNAPSASIPDPPWFSPALLPKARVTKKGRSPADDQGRFTAQILFAFPPDATLEDCTGPLAEALAKIVPEVKREESDGRVTLSGDTAEHHVLFICGDAKGTLTAFTSYRWTQPPPAAQ